ncbi:MAG: SRPBCC domain-containing protein [Calditrichaceae bacterium]
MKKGDKPVVVKQSFKRPVSDVWNAITDIDLMKKWYFDNIPLFKAEVGFKTQFNVTNEGRNFLHLWEITEVVPPKKIAYSWKFKEYPGEGLVEFELSAQNDLTTLTLTNSVLESFPDDIPEFTRESCTGGWEYFIQNRLKEYLEQNIK